MTLVSFLYSNISALMYAFRYLLIGVLAAPDLCYTGVRSRTSMLKQECTENLGSMDSVVSAENLGSSDGT